MDFKATFNENNQIFNTFFSQSNSNFNANMGELKEVTKLLRGATFYPSVSTNGVISWTNDYDLENPTPVNIKGEKGERGEQGIQGIQGERGDKGEKGDTGAQGIQGVQGIQGERGEKGEKGNNGYTPIKGVDYFTDTEKAEFVQAVISSLPVYKGEVIEL